MDAIISSIVDLYSAIAGFAAEHPKLTGTISIGTVLAAFWTYWKRPIINVRFGKKEGSHAPVTVDFKNAQGEVVGRAPVKYFRMRIRNIGLTTINKCSGQLIKVTRRVAGREPAIFDSDEYHLGWAHYDQSDSRDIQPRQSHQMDLATLVLQPVGPNRLVIGGLGRRMPNTLGDFLNSYSGKATYTLDVLISSDNGRPRQVPIEVAFDPEQDDLTYVPLNTRFPWWRLWWRLRAQWSRWRASERRGAFTLACMLLLIIVLLIVWLPVALGEPLPVPKPPGATAERMVAGHRSIATLRITEAGRRALAAA